MAGDEPTEGSANEVTDVPQGFKQWVGDNQQRITTAKSLPYFIKDNPRYAGMGKFEGTKLGRKAKKEAAEVYADSKPPTLSPEQRANIEEIAEAFGIEVKPMTFQEADGGRANSGYGKNELYSQNCQSCVVVHEARLRGLNITARPYDATETSAQFRLGEDTAIAWRTAKGEKPTLVKLEGKTDEELFRKLDKQTKATGRYLVGINFNPKDGHIITAERLPGGKLVFYDAQNGNFPNIRENTGLESIEILKIDKLLLVPEIIKAIARRL